MHKYWHKSLDYVCVIYMWVKVNAGNKLYMMKCAGFVEIDQLIYVRVTVL